MPTDTENQAGHRHAGAGGAGAAAAGAGDATVLEGLGCRPAGSDGSSLRGAGPVAVSGRPLSASARSSGGEGSTTRESNGSNPSRGQGGKPGTRISQGTSRQPARVSSISRNLRIG